MGVGERLFLAFDCHALHIAHVSENLTERATTALDVSL